MQSKRPNAIERINRTQSVNTDEPTNEPSNREKQKSNRERFARIEWIYRKIGQIFYRIRTLQHALYYMCKYGERMMRELHRSNQNESLLSCWVVFPKFVFCCCCWFVLCNPLHGDSTLHILRLRKHWTSGRTSDDKKANKNTNFPLIHFYPVYWTHSTFNVQLLSSTFFTLWNSLMLLLNINFLRLLG